ncbi:hypothetical protein WMC41_11835 [Shinella yambaruensis]|uniref:hypothetical protein n=1 Tax=Shinella yambaruensis TaxID=415996 RepID=UPI003D798C90
MSISYLPAQPGFMAIWKSEGKKFWAPVIGWQIVEGQEVFPLVAGEQPDDIVGYETERGAIFGLNVGRPYPDFVPGEAA